MNDQVQSLVMEFLLEKAGKGTEKDISNFAMVSKSTNTPHAQQVLNKLKMDYLYREIRFWKQRTHLTTLNAKVLLSLEPLVLTYFTEYLKTSDYFEDLEEYNSRKSHAECLKHIVGQNEKIKRMWIRE